jgi:hypothetical protein
MRRLIAGLAFVVVLLVIVALMILMGSQLPPM